ncbi:MAG: hypothetical protein HY355_00185 [Armatimonadetes bacterium]|nr:hypothetical protein [Armatimonadota bacterium]
MGEARDRYAAVVYALAVVGIVCAALIVYGEMKGGPDRLDLWQLGGAALGGIFVVYGLIILMLRRLGTIGPRRAEAEDDLRGRWTKPVP